MESTRGIRYTRWETRRRAARRIRMTAGASDRLPDPLADALVRSGGLTPEAARAALDRQVVHGGALDTALLEVGVPETSILAAMTEVYDAVMASPREIAGGDDPRALRTLPEQWALRHRLPPVRLTDGGRTLIVLSPAPPDLDLIARLSELLDVTVVPHLALEVRVVEALSRLYGTKPPDRFLPLLVQRSRPATGATSVAEPLAFSEASARLREPANRHDIARALLGYALRELAFGSLWVVKEKQLEGWMGFGAGSDRLPAAELAIEDGSAADVVIESQAHYLGPSPEDETQRALLSALGRQAPRSVLMVPLRVKNRVVALLYGENGPHAIPGRLAGDIMLLVSQVQTAFEQLLLRQKAESLSQLSRVPDSLDESTVESGAPIDDEDLEIEPPAVGRLVDDADELGLYSEQPTLPEPPPQSSDPAADLPDEPFPPVPSPDEDWDEVEVAEGNFVEGYEVVPPRVLTAQDQIVGAAEPVPVATAPQASRNLPPVTSQDIPPDLSSDGLRLVPSELAPRAIASEGGDSDDLYRVARAETVVGRSPTRRDDPSEMPDEVLDAASEDEADAEEPTFPSMRVEPRGEDAAELEAGPGPTPDPAPTVELSAAPSPAREAGPEAAPAWNGPFEGEDAGDAAPDADVAPAFEELEASRENAEIEALVEIEEPEALAGSAAEGALDLPPFDADPSTFDVGASAAAEPSEALEEALWAEAGRGLAESLLNDGEGDEGVGHDRDRGLEPLAPDQPAPATRSEPDENWDPAESNSWSMPTVGPISASRAPRTESQPLLLVQRAPAPDADRGADDPVPSAAMESGGPAPAVDDAQLGALLELLGEPDVEALGQAQARLAELGPSMLPQAMDRFPGPLVVDPFQRKSIPPFEACGPLLGLVARAGEDAHPYVARKLDAPDPRVRFYAAYFYSSVQVPEVIPRLIQRLHDEEPRICMMAARTLFGYRGHPDFNLVLEHLHGRLGATSIAARRHAAYLIGLFRDVSALPLLIDIVERRERNMVDVALDALAEITKQQFGPYPRRWRSWLEKNRDRSRIEWLIEGLSAKDDAIRRSAAEELRAVTGQDFGFEPEAPRRRREEAKQRWLSWWDREQTA